MLRPTLLCVIGLALRSLLPAAEFNVASATNQVGLDLYRQLAGKQPETNLVISPYSIESALALAYAGADGLTRDEMAAALHFPPDEAAVRPALAALRKALATISSESAKIASTRRREGSQVYAIIGGKRVGFESDPTPGIVWHEANRLFAQKDYAFRDSFLKLMRDGYAAPLEPVDFLRNAEQARGTINDWVEASTQGKIKDLIPPRGVNGSRLVLVNALYLKAPWETPFEKTFTRPETFHFSGTTVGEVPTMRHIGYLGYARESGFTVVSLEYIGRELRFLIILPDEGRTVDAVAAKLTPADFGRWAKLGRETPSKRVSLHLPRFRVEGATLSLGEALRQLGMKSAFDEPPGSANFDRIAPRRADDYLKISEVYHQTFIALDEEGTEAAAATGAAMGYGAGPAPDPIEVRVDRPFLFAIQHRASATCLFLGRIADPR
jgi:serpin B